MSDLKQKSIELEHFHTPEWAAKAILKKEVLTNVVLDPCCGTGVLTDAVREQGYAPIWLDIHDWGYHGTQVRDFLKVPKIGMPSWAYRSGIGFSVFMNPPFSKACEFVEKSFELGARKIVCFQRFAWWESAERKEFWKKRPPSRVYICGSRADCWRHDLAILPPEQRINPKTGKKMSSSPTAHAWFVFERDHAGGTQLGHIWKDEK